MKVILNDYVENLGERGSIIDVKPGFARNFLLPKGLAYLDTPGNRRQFEQEQRHWESMELKRRSAADEAASTLAGTELHFERRAGETGTLFGSVTSTEIADALTEKGFEVNRRKVAIVEPLKQIGIHEITVNLHREVAVPVTIVISRPGGSKEDVLAELGEATGAMEAEPTRGEDAPEAEAGAESVEADEVVEA